MKVKNTEKPNRCPFCKGTRVLLQMKKGRKFINGLDHPIEEHKWYAYCTRCKARGPIASGKVNLYENYVITPETRAHFPRWQRTDNELRAEAMELWNRRPTP